MGTRASFWIGDPVDLENREWLGCIAWDGYPGCDDFDGWKEIGSQDAFRAAVQTLADSRDDFASPNGGWPFPWTGDMFWTDHTYAFFNGSVHVCWYHGTFTSFAEARRGDVGDPDDPAHHYVPAPGKWNPHQPDSIMIFTGLTDGSIHMANNVGAVPPLA